MKLIFGVIFFVVLNTFCKGQTNDDGKTYNKTFEVGQIPYVENFLKFNKNESFLDSLFLNNNLSLDSIDLKENRSDTSYKNFFMHDFVHNRSRIYVDEYQNNKLQEMGDTSSKEDRNVSTFCECITRGDTLLITMNVGFFGGNGFDIKLFQGNFISDFYTYINNGEPYKTHLADKHFADNAKEDNKFQYLIIDKVPTYKSGQQLTGYFTFTSNNYHERQFGKLDSIYVKGRIHFTCKTQKDYYLQ